MVLVVDDREPVVVVVVVGSWELGMIERESIVEVKPQYVVDRDVILLGVILKFYYF